MPEWWTYRAEDFLLFSPQVYWRLFVLENQSHWPLPLVALALGGLALVALARPWVGSDRLLWAVIGAAWVWVAWSFLATRYAEINWMAAYVAPAFAAQGLALVWAGAARGRLRLGTGRSAARFVGAGLFLYALALHPLLPLATGRPLASAEIVGIAPDPTAFATLGLLLAAEPGWRRVVLSVVPLLWCILSWATLRTMAAEVSVVPLTIALLFVFSVGLDKHRRRA